MAAVPFPAWPLYLTVWRNRYIDLRLVGTERVPPAGIAADEHEERE